MTIDLLYLPGCPHVDAARELLRACLASLGQRDPVVEHEGAFPSPTIRIDGIDVMGAPPAAHAACRLDVPTSERLLVALRRRRYARRV